MSSQYSVANSSADWSVKIPIDVVEEIFKTVHSNGSASLKNCAVACRAFLLLARTQLFRDVTIRLEPMPHPLSPPIDGAGQRQPSNLLAFLSGDRAVSSNVRHLSLQRAPAKGDGQLGHGTWATTIDLLGRLLPGLEGLLHLSVHASFFADWTHEDRHMGPMLMRFAGLPNLMHLELSYVAIPQSEMHNFLQVPRVTLLGAYVNYEDGDLDNMDTTMDATTHAEKSVLKDLCVVLRAPECADEMWSFVRAASLYITSLTWMPNTSTGNHEGCLHCLDLTIFPLLSHLNISLYLHDESSLLVLTALLKSGNSGNTLETLGIACDYNRQSVPDEATMSSWNWGELDDLLTSTVYANMREVKIGDARQAQNVGRAALRNDRSGRAEADVILARFRRLLPKIASLKRLEVK